MNQKIKILTQRLTLVIIVLLGTIGIIQVADATTISMLDPTVLPQDGGWSVMDNGVNHLDVSTNGSSLTLNTIGVESANPTPGMVVQWFYQDVPLAMSSGFSIDFSLQVHEIESPHNSYDGGIVFYASTIDPSSNFAGGPRGQMIFFDEGFIGWGDETDTYTLDTTDAFHHYNISVTNTGVAQVFVDGNLALDRNNFEVIPRIGFGDMTNDIGVNGSFSIESIFVTAAPIPEPATILLFGTGFVGFAVSRIRSKKTGVHRVKP